MSKRGVKDELRSWSKNWTAKFRVTPQGVARRSGKHRGAQTAELSSGRKKQATGGTPKK